MPTTSSDATMTQLRNRLLNFAPLLGSTLAIRLGSRLYKDFAPDATAYPMGIMRLINRFTDGAYNSDRETADLEVMLFTDSRAQAGTLEDIADLCDQAMLRYVDSSSGIIFSRRRQRDTLPPPVDPADREVAQIRLLYPLVMWPLYLTNYSAT